MSIETIGIGYNYCEISPNIEFSVDKAYLVPSSTDALRWAQNTGGETTKLINGPKTLGNTSH